MFSDLDIENVRYTKEIVRHRLEPFLDIVNGVVNVRGDFWVAGGCIASTIQHEAINDVDVYFRTPEIGAAVKEFYINKHPGLIKDVNTAYQELEVDGKLVTSNAVTLKDGIQIITIQYGSPSKVRQNFDYVHCLPYYDSADDKLYISEQQYHLCKNKILKRNTTNVSAKREQKFLARGYKYEDSIGLENVDPWLTANVL